MCISTLVGLRQLHLSCTPQQLDLEALLSRLPLLTELSLADIENLCDLGPIARLTALEVCMWPV